MSESENAHQFRFRPLLAATVESFDTLTYPLVGSPKIDGIRCLVIGGIPMSRSLKPIPNRYIQRQIAEYGAVLNNFDGELVVADQTGKTLFHDTASAVMSQGGEPRFIYQVFDCFKSNLVHIPYHGRLEHLNSYRAILPPWVFILEQNLLDNAGIVAAEEERYVRLGYEGLMLRDPNGKYKYGRSTLKEGILLKVKRFVDAEASIIDFEERHHNDNAPEQSALGYQVRSTHRANQRPAGDLGALVVQHKNFPGPFRIGSGFDEAQRREIWQNRNSYRGMLAKFKYQLVGTKDLPRAPIFLGFRHPDDL